MFKKITIHIPATISSFKPFKQEHIDLTYEGGVIKIYRRFDISSSLTYRNDDWSSENLDFVGVTFYFIRMLV